MKPQVRHLWSAIDLQTGKPTGFELFVRFEFQDDGNWLPFWYAENDVTGQKTEPARLTLCQSRDLDIAEINVRNFFQGQMIS